MQESIEKPERRWCVIPIHTLSKRECNYSVPFGLRALKGIHVDRVLANQKTPFNTDINIDALEVDDLDKFFVNQMQRLFNARLREKLARESRQKRQKEIWAKNERLRLFELITKERNEEALREEKHKREIELLRKETQADFEKRKAQIASMELQDFNRPRAEPVKEYVAPIEVCTGIT